MADLPLLGTEDERSRDIGGRAAMWAFTALSALLLAVIVIHVGEHGLSNFGAVRFEIAAFLLGWIVYVGMGLYYTRTM